MCVCASMCVSLCVCVCYHNMQIAFPAAFVLEHMPICCLQIVVQWLIREKEIAGSLDFKVAAVQHFLHACDLADEDVWQMCGRSSF